MRDTGKALASCLRLRTSLGRVTGWDESLEPRDPHQWNSLYELQHFKTGHGDEVLLM